MCTYITKSYNDYRRVLDPFIIKIHFLKLIKFLVCHVQHTKEEWDYTYVYTIRTRARMHTHTHICIYIYIYMILTLELVFNLNKGPNLV